MAGVWIWRNGMREGEARIYSPLECAVMKIASIHRREGEGNEEHKL